MSSFHFWTLLRLLFPLSTLYFPFLGGVLATILDLLDYNHLPLSTENDFSYYQTWDKSLDTYFLTLAFFTTRSWKDKNIKRVATVLYFYRLVGFLLFINIKKEELLFFFPNIFEGLFFFYLIYKKITQKEKLFTNLRTTTLVLISVSLPKIAQEYYIHIDNFQKTIINSLPFYSQLILYSFLPSLVFIWLIRKNRYA